MYNWIKFGNCPFFCLQVLQSSMGAAAPWTWMWTSSAPKKFLPVFDDAMRLMLVTHTHKQMEPCVLCYERKKWNQATWALTFSLSHTLLSYHLYFSSFHITNSKHNDVGCQTLVWPAAFRSQSGVNFSLAFCFFCPPFLCSLLFSNNRKWFS